MAHYRAQIIAEDGKVVADVDVWLEIVDPSSTRLGSWNGSLTLPEKNQFDLQVRYYRMRLSDGREGDLFWTQFNPIDRRVIFQGTGPLARKS